MTLVMDVLSRQQTDKVRPSLRSVQATYQSARTNKPEHVKVDFNMSILADDSLSATEAFEAFQREIRAQPWYLHDESKQSDPVENGRGIYLSSVSIDVDVSKTPVPKESQ